MSEGNVTIPASTAKEIALMLRSKGRAPGWNRSALGSLYVRWANELDPQDPDPVDTPAVDYMEWAYMTWADVNPTYTDRDLAEWAVATIATWLRARNTNSLAADMLLGGE